VNCVPNGLTQLLTATFEVDALQVSSIIHNYRVNAPNVGRPCCLLASGAKFVIGLGCERELTCPLPLAPPQPSPRSAAGAVVCHTSTMATKTRVGAPFPRKWVVFGFWILVELCISESQILAHVDTCAFDWDAYMEQVSKMLPSTSNDITPQWNFNYSTLNGDTGPLVYPAGHVWIHLGLKHLFQWDAATWTTEVTPKMIAGARFIPKMREYACHTVCF
jgi:hypothetical protein